MRRCSPRAGAGRPELRWRFRVFRAARSSRRSFRACAPKICWVLYSPIRSRAAKTSWAIAKVRGESWPEAVNPDELHDGLSWLGFLTEGEVAAQPNWRAWLEQLATQNRVLRLTALQPLWIAAERLPDFQALWPALKTREDIALTLPAEPHPSDEALLEIIRGRLEGLGPV